ncbi:MAG: hypothetical protein ACRC30_11870 [Clostridium sp.]
MIAELYGKISGSGVNLSDGLEDNLTGNVFGSLRYIPFSKGIKKILLKVIDEADFDKYELEEWAEQIEFWPYHKEGELDLIINLSLVTVAIEVKYNSGLSSDDDVVNLSGDFKKSRNQLARESRIVKEKAEENGTKPILLFISKENKGKEIIDNVRKRNIIENGVILKFISWEEIYLIIENIYKNDILNYYEKLIIENIYRLLERKGFNSFKTFKNISNITIEEKKSYSFEVNGHAKRKSLGKFEFISNIEIKGGKHYEFV